MNQYLFFKLQNSLAVHKYYLLVNLLYVVQSLHYKVFVLSKHHCEYQFIGTNVINRLQYASYKYNFL